MALSNMPEKLFTGGTFDHETIVLSLKGDKRTFSSSFYNEVE